MNYPYQCTGCQEIVEVEHPEEGLHMRLLPFEEKPTTTVPRGWAVTMHYKDGTHLIHLDCNKADDVMGLTVYPMALKGGPRDAPAGGVGHMETPLRP